MSLVRTSFLGFFSCLFIVACGGAETGTDNSDVSDMSDAADVSDASDASDAT